MEFMNRGNRPNQVPGSTASSTSSTPVKPSKGLKTMFGLKLASIVLLFSATTLVVALLWTMVLGSPASQSKHVDKDKMQAVFLNGGQVYFGRIRDLNSNYMRVGDIYYLRVNQQVQPDQENQQPNANDISLVKLGCELHGPEDEMLINSEQVVFWENLKDDGQVAKAVAEYKKQNPNGQNCEQQTQQNSNNAGSNANSQNNADNQEDQ